MACLQQGQTKHAHVSLSKSAHISWPPQVAFEKVGSMPMARIETIRVTKQADVDVELAKRSRSKQLREAVSMSERHAPHASHGAHSITSAVHSTGTQLALQART